MQNRHPGLVGLALFVMAMATVTASAAAEPLNAGVASIDAKDDGGVRALVFYPTSAPLVPTRAGPFDIPATRDAAISSERQWPVVLFSHGGGRSGGTPLVHRALLAHIAKNGFVVIAPFHGKEGRRIVRRPEHVRLAFNAVRLDPRFAGSVDPDRVGMAGFSLGGAVSLILAGAAPDFAALMRYCRETPGDRRACRGVETTGPVPKLPAIDALPVKALALLDPYGAPFSHTTLRAIHMPVMIVRPGASDLNPDGNALALAKAIPGPVEQDVIPGGHFVLIDPCPPALVSEAADACIDAPGIDRAGIHAALRTKIVAFLHTNLADDP